MTLVEKLHPSRFSEMSPKMAAIVGCILGERWVTPYLIGMVITSDHCVLARAEGDCGYNHFLGSEQDLAQNLARLQAAADLTDEEAAEFAWLQHKIIRYL